MHDLQVADRADTPLYRRIADAVREAVAAQRIDPGARLPAHLALARQLGVSPVTVSRSYELLESQGIVRQRRGSGTYLEPEALRRVQQAARRSFGAIVVVAGEKSLSLCRRETLFTTTDVLDGMRDVLGERQTHFLFVESFTRDALSHLKDDDALLFICARQTDPSLVSEFAQRQTPCVGVRPDLAVSGMPQVYFDVRQSVAVACEHLVDCGYRRVGFIGIQSRQDGSVPDKFDAFAGTLPRLGLDLQARYIADVKVDPGKAYEAAQKFIQAGDLPDAFFVDTDYKAMEVICALNEAGLKVPEDIGIVSYDDVPEAALFDPPLTTVRTPRRETGRRAAQMLIGWPTDGTSPTDIVLDSQLVVRASTRAVGTAASAAAVGDVES